jgi:hypothetical protein
MLISALFVVMQLNNYVHAQITTSVAATPAEKVCAIGNESAFSVTGNCTANGVQGQESIQNCQWKYVGITAYSDEACTTEDSTIVSATTAADNNWATLKLYTKEVKIKGLKAGTSWVKFRMKYRLDSTSDGTEVISTTPVKIVVKNITLTAPRWLQKGEEGKIEITYDATVFTDGSIELSGLSDLYDIIDSDFVEGVTNNATINPTDGKLTWALTGRTGTKAGKIVVKIKGKNPKESTLTATHSKSDAKAETDVGVFYVDVILGGVEEDKEETTGAFFATKKRASLVLKAEPKSAGETATLLLTGLDLYDSATGDQKNNIRSWNLVSEDLPTSLYVGGSTSSSMKDKVAKLTWKSKDDTAKATAVEVKIKVGNSDEEKSDKKAYLRYYDPIPTPQPDKSKTSVEFTYLPSDLNVGKLKATVGSTIKLLKKNDNSEAMPSQEWDLTTNTGRTDAKTFNGVAKSISSNVIDVSLKHEDTDATDEAKIHIYQLAITSNTKVIDPKLNGAGKIESTFKYSDSITFDGAVWDGANKVKTLTKDNSNWDGKWDNGTNANKFADPKKYQITVKLYKDTAKTKQFDTESIDIYVVRLGIEAIEFNSHDGGIYVPMQFHTTSASINTGLADSTTKWKYDIPWQLSNEGATLNVDQSDGSAALAEDTIYTETFYPKTRSTSQLSTYHNYPICFVKNSKIKIKPTPSKNYVSHIEGTAKEGTIPSDAPDIYLKVKRKKPDTSYGTEKTTTNKISAGTAVEIELDDLVKNSVGNETIEFEYNWFYKNGTTNINIPGNFKSTHKCYTIVDTPHTPWGIATGNEYPWLAVIDVATSSKMAEGIICNNTDLKPLYTKMEKAINELEGDFGKESSNLIYDLYGGGPNYCYSANTVDYLCMSNFLLFLKSDKTPEKSMLQNKNVTNNVVNCADCALLLKAFTNIIGGNLQCGQMVRHFSLNPIVPIGNSQFSAFVQRNSGFFRMHVVTISEAIFNDSSKIYDSCLKLGTPDPTKCTLGFNATTNNCKLSDGLSFFDSTNCTISNIEYNISSGGNGTCVVTRTNSAAYNGISASYIIEATSNTTFKIIRDNTIITVLSPVSGMPIDLVGTVGTVTAIDGFEILITNGTLPFDVNDKFKFSTTYNYNFYKPSLATPGQNGRRRCNWGAAITFNLQ